MLRSQLGIVKLSEMGIIFTHRLLIISLAFLQKKR